MRSNSLNVKKVVTLLQKVAADLPGHIEEIRSLDALLGDGDLGITLDLISKALGEYLISPDMESIGKLLIGCGMRINKATPSTFATLLTMGCLGAGKALTDKQEIGIQDLASIGKNAISGIQKLGKAEVGDKTVNGLILHGGAISPARSSWR